jgi:phosphoribosylformimino-5-aminoimidazole carboxamide ribotide isomerase
VDIFPSIEIRNGRVVGSGPRVEGERVDPDPVARAERLVWQGATWLHLVDLDRAFGDGENAAAVGRIVTRVGSYVRLQLRGGIRTREACEAVRDLEVTRVVVDPLEGDPTHIDAALDVLGAYRVALGVDGRDGFVSLRGWSHLSTIRAADLARRASSVGVRTMVYRDIARHGTFNGLDVETAGALQREGLGVIVNGGTAALTDVALARDAGLAGLIVDYALIEGRFTLAEALRVAAGG